MNRGRNRLAARWIRVLGLPASLAAVTCGGSPAAGDATVDDSELGTAQAPLYPDISTCHTNAGGIDVNILASTRPSLQHVESSLENRLATCNAWVVDYVWNVSLPIMNFRGFARDGSEANADDCSVTWTSDRIYGRTSGGSFSTLHDRDTAAVWSGSSCTYGSVHFPSQSQIGSGITLQQSAPAARDRPSNYTSIRVINQAFYAFWPILGLSRYDKFVP